MVNVEVNASPIIRDEEVIGVEGIFRDITERKKLEQLRRNSRRERGGRKSGTSSSIRPFVKI
ncbi:PAS domain S-box protein [Candidatus Bathyarchaeota archaeon]|nr:PAS domain S-box protein [Candidatus Bathyarchaeota archaeon]